MKLKSLAPYLVSTIFLTTPAFAKQVGEAIQDMGGVQDTDPNGFKLMVISIGMIFCVALTLIGVTTAYMLKGKKQAK